MDGVAADEAGAGWTVGGDGMTRLVEIDGLVFTGEPGPGDRYVFSDLPAGWFGGAPVRFEAQDRPEADGAFGFVRNYRGARVLKFTGHLIGADVQSAEEELFDAFAAIQADGTPITLSVTTGSGTRTVSGTVLGEPEVSPDWSMRRATVKATFLCPDPVKYGPAVTVSTGLPVEGGGLDYPLGDPGGALFYGAAGSSGRMTLVNGGTAEVWPVFTVSGALADGFELRCVGTGERVRYSRVVPAGSTVTVDAGAGSVLIDGVSDGSTYLTAAEFFPVPAGGSCEVQFSAVSTGDGSVVASVRSGWW